MAPPRPGLTRRRVLALTMGVAALRGARAEAQPLQTPRTLLGCVESMETLMSPEALDKIAELSEARQHEYRPRLRVLEAGAVGRGVGRSRPRRAGGRVRGGRGRAGGAEVQAHAARGESSPGELPRERAVAVVQELVRLGVPAERLTAHGLSTRFPYRARAFDTAPKKDARDADARAEFFILRRAEA